MVYGSLALPPLCLTCTQLWLMREQCNNCQGDALEPKEQEAICAELSAASSLQSPASLSNGFEAVPANTPEQALAAAALEIAAMKKKQQRKLQELQTRLADKNNERQQLKETCKAKFDQLREDLRRLHLGNAQLNALAPHSTLTPLETTKINAATASAAASAAAAAATSTNDADVSGPSPEAGAVEVESSRGLEGVHRQLLLLEKLRVLHGGGDQSAAGKQLKRMGRRLARLLGLVQQKSDGLRTVAAYFFQDQMGAGGAGAGRESTSDGAGVYPGGGSLLLPLSASGADAGGERALEDEDEEIEGLRRIRRSVSPSEGPASPRWADADSQAGTASPWKRPKQPDGEEQIKKKKKVGEAHPGSHQPTPMHTIGDLVFPQRTRPPPALSTMSNIGTVCSDEDDEEGQEEREKEGGKPQASQPAAGAEPGGLGSFQENRQHAGAASAAASPPAGSPLLLQKPSYARAQEFDADERQQQRGLQAAGGDDEDEAVLLSASVAASNKHQGGSFFGLMGVKAEASSSSLPSPAGRPRRLSSRGAEELRTCDAIHPNAALAPLRPTASSSAKLIYPPNRGTIASLNLHSPASSGRESDAESALLPLDDEYFEELPPMPLDQLLAEGASASG
eukprot:GHVT01005893.1.p1 GENE.GHVT01005893.1~~GHVT01005893.1.p1  ORF type:complete len:624 (+),score=190.83 GHVT01005893.1:314-2185(+)